MYAKAVITKQLPFLTYFSKYFSNYPSYRLSHPQVKTGLGKVSYVNVHGIQCYNNEVLFNFIFMNTNLTAYRKYQSILLSSYNWRENIATYDTFPSVSARVGRSFGAM